MRYPCPCCGYPTLPRRGWQDICGLCSWHDDGQDDPHADEVWGDRIAITL
ncbi:CPCC family cysteine-rich protein [Capsulimonas corticalis]